MRVLGIDPGLANCGWGIVIDDAGRNGKTPLRAFAYGSIATSPRDSLPVRLGQIFSGLSAVIERYEPAELGIESIYHKGNPRSSMATAQARGAALAAAASREIPVCEYAPAAVKLSVVGHGSATKKQVQYMVRAILGLDHEPSPDHAADALAVAICHCHSRKAPG
jgi:crossover junction endodeoxyribonuclease RuvC